jgi:hypothetical protein
LLPSDPEFAAPEPPPPTASQSSFQLPAEYYAAPVVAKPLVPSWVPFGCGGAALLFLVVLFAGATMISSGAISGLLDFTFNTMEGEIARMFASDVSPAQRAAFTKEMQATRANIRNGRSDLRLLQPLIATIQEAVSDKLVNASETEQMMSEMQKANAEAAKPRPKKKS